jgi:predicted nuclease with TOPRIM domain
MFPDWAQKNATLVAGFGAPVLIIADAKYSRRDIKGDISALEGKVMNKVNELRTEVNELRTEVKGDIRELRTDINELRTDVEYLQSLLLACAVKTMKAVDGDKTELREFVRNAEKALRCAGLGEDCKEGVRKGSDQSHG